MQRLLDHYNHDVLPVVYQRGSLAPPAIWPAGPPGAALLGLGEVRWAARSCLRCARAQGAEVGSAPAGSQGGLALLNGTQFMNAYATLLLLKCQRLAVLADAIAAVSLDATTRAGALPSGRACRAPPSRTGAGGRPRARPARGQRHRGREKEHAGPVLLPLHPAGARRPRDAFGYVERVVEHELEAVTDNPTVFDEGGPGGERGQLPRPAAGPGARLPAIAAAELGSISERRTYKAAGR